MNFHLKFTIICWLIHIDWAIVEATKSLPQSIKQSDMHSRSIEPTLKHYADETLILFDNQIIDALIVALSDIVSGNCLRQVNMTINGLRTKQSWAMTMYDASVKVPTGLEYGNLYQFGNFDECIDINKGSSIIRTDNIQKEGSIQTKYCLIDIGINDVHVKMDALRSTKQSSSTIVHWGVCMPIDCSSNDIVRFISAVTGYEDVIIQKNNCHINEPITKFQTIDIVYGCILAGFLSMVIFCTCHHIYAYLTMDPLRKSLSSNEHSSTFEQLIKSFSAIENLQKLIKAGNDDNGLAVINGIKAISMIFIITGHALLFFIGGPVLNTDFYAKEIKLIQNTFLLNSPLFVDTFLFLSGFLFARLIFIELTKRNGKINFGLLYLFRYIRLTPAYFAIIALYATILPKLGSGPLWDARMILEQERCQSSWWLNILYINNYIQTDKLCMFQSWYLAADTQLFILAPLILYPLWRWNIRGLMGLIGLCLVSILIPIIVTYVEDSDPTLLIFSNEVTDISSNAFFINTYIKTHMRATAYLVGILTGYLVHYATENKTKISNKTSWICWISSILIGSVSMFSLTIFLHPIDHSTLSRALYSGLHRFGWSIATGWIIFSTVTNYSGFLRRILAAQALVPLSRLTYCAYLTNGLVELYSVGSIRVPKYMSIITLLGETSSHIFLTFLTALILCLVFESPILGIEKIFLRKEPRNVAVITPSTNIDSYRNRTDSITTSEEDA